MKVAISGGTGFVGGKLTDLLKKEGHEVIILTRGEEKVEDNVRYIRWMNGAKPEQSLEGIDAFINLAGVSLNEGRWTKERKKALYESRMSTTGEVIRIVENLQNRPSVYVNASAVGIYPVSTTVIYDENSPQKAADFLGTTVADWEEKAARAEKLGIRTCFTRFGVILGKEEGALPLMVLPYQLFIGGTVGSGEQWVSWVHVDDVVRAILHVIETPTLHGPVNVTSPNAKRMKYFGKTIGRAFNRPHWLPIPSIAMKAVLGEKSILVLKGQYVIPKKLLNTNFKFQFASLEDAICNLYKS